MVNEETPDVPVAGDEMTGDAPVIEESQAGDGDVAVVATPERNEPVAQKKSIEDLHADYKKLADECTAAAEVGDKPAHGRLMSAKKAAYKLYNDAVVEQRRAEKARR